MAKFELVPLSLDWFIDNIDEHVKRPEIREFQEIVGFEYRDILDPEKRAIIADKICDHSSIFYEIRRAKGGAFFPEKVYRKDVNFYNKAPQQIPRADEIILHRPMCYSLNLRFGALAHAIIPYIFDTRFNGRDGTVLGNLGSGLGKDLQLPVVEYNGFVRKVVNIDADKDVIEIGRKELPEELTDKVEFYRGNFLKGNPEGVPYDFCLLVGIICPLTDKSAELLLSIVHDQMASGGTIAVSSSSYKMADHDPICSINIQLSAQWALNCRTEDQLYSILKNVGFKNVEVLYEPSGYNLIGIGSKQ